MIFIVYFDFAIIFFFQQVRKGHVWLEGDNKINSIDSRIYGQVPYGLLHGRVFYIVSYDQNMK